MMYKLHNQGKDRFVYTCNNCKSHVETRYHCTVCDDFDLCCVCKEKDGHPHKMEKLGFDLDVGSSPGDNSSSIANNPADARKLSIQRCIQSFVHVCQCCDANCPLPSCRKMKRIVQHTKLCKRKTNGGCTICKQLFALCCYHAKHCLETKCPVSFCLNIKHKLRQQQVQRMQQTQLLRRRMATMMIDSRAPAPVSSPTTPGGPPAIQGGLLTPHQSPGPMTGVGGGMMAAIPHNQGIEMKPQMHTPPANVLQVVKQVQEEAAHQQVPHPGVGYGKVCPSMSGPQQPTQQSQASVPQPVMPPPSPIMQQRSVTHHQQNLTMVGVGQHNMSGPPNRMLPGMDQMGPRYPGMGGMAGQGINPGLYQPVPPPPNAMMGGEVAGTANNQMVSQLPPQNSNPLQGQEQRAILPHALQQFLQLLKAPALPSQQQQVLQILKSNPQLMAAFIKDRQLRHMQQQANPQQQQQQQQQAPVSQHMIQGIQLVQVQQSMLLQGQSVLMGQLGLPPPQGPVPMVKQQQHMLVMQRQQQQQQSQQQGQQRSRMALYCNSFRVRSPPSTHVRSPQLNPSPRNVTMIPLPSPSNQLIPSPRSQPSPHHVPQGLISTPSHSPHPGMSGDGTTSSSAGGPSEMMLSQLPSSAGNVTGNCMQFTWQQGYNPHQDI